MHVIVWELIYCPNVRNVISMIFSFFFPPLSLLYFLFIEPRRVGSSNNFLMDMSFERERQENEK
jgi:hypothetical protein